MVLIWIFIYGNLFKLEENRYNSYKLKILWTNNLFWKSQKNIKKFKLYFISNFLDNEGISNWER